MVRTERRSLAGSKHFPLSDSSDSESSTASDSSNGSPRINKHGKGKVNPFNVADSGKEKVEEEMMDGEDTMKDLRTTFAGIFGDRK